ncbi:MAG: DNA internalization-related competence protein ComEC/Rec2 [Burkholderiales bacterium]
MRLNLLLFVAGAAVLQHQASLPAWEWGLVLPPFFVAAMLIPQRLPREMVLKGFFLLAGFFYAAIFAQVRLSDALPVKWEGRDIDVVGIVAGLPRSGEKGQSFSFDVESVETPGAIVPRKIMLSRYFGTDRVNVHPGERWRFKVRLRRPHGNANPYGFDYEAWLLERGIRATGYVREEALLKSSIAEPSSFVEVARERLRDRVYAALPGFPYSGVIAALLMGEQKTIPESNWQVFRRTGVIHLMSISGLHETMVAGLFAWFAYRMWRLSPLLVLKLPARKIAALAGVLSAFCYALLAGYAVPTQRTVYMLVVVAAALWSGKMAFPSIILCWALFVVTALDPWAVLSPGFWLSFIAVALIMYVGTGRIRRASWLQSWISVQWAVTIGLVPVLLAFFQQISLVSPIANAIAIPVVSFMVIPLTLLGAVMPFDFPFFLAHRIFSLLMLLLVKLSNLPDAVWMQHAPPTWTLFTAALGVAWILLPRGFPVRWLGFSGLAPLFLFFPPNPELLRLAVLDVGQGLAAVVQTKHHALLFDAGPAFSPQADSGNRIIVPYLRGSGIDRLDAVILSHEDMDHIGGAISVFDSIPVGWMLSSLPKDNPVLSHVANHLRCRSGQSWIWDEVRFEILWPPAPGYLNPKITGNARSCVLRVSSKEGSILITGDIEKGAEGSLAKNQNLESDVLIAPHHGARSSGDFAHAVSPRYAVFSAGYRNRFNHPRPEVVALYEKAGSRVLRTDSDGALIFDFSPAGISETSWRNVHRRYWFQEK